MRGLNLVPYFRRDAKIEVQPLIAFSNLIDNVNVMNWSFVIHNPSTGHKL